MTTSKKLAILALAALFGLGIYLHHAGLAGSGPLAAVVVEDTAHRTPAIGAALADPDLLAFVRQKQIAWHVLDQAAAGPDLAEVQWALDAAKTHPLPALVTRRGAGRPQTFPLPPSSAAIRTLLGRLAG